MTERIRVRPTARVVVVDPAGRVLLFGARLQKDPAAPHHSQARGGTLQRGRPAVPPGDVLFWYTPGGGVEDGETLRDAAVRELAEEIGLQVAAGDLEGPVWLRRSVGPFAGEQIDNRETYFALRGVVHEVAPGELTELELLAEEPHRWWSLAEIGGSGEQFAPRRLADLLPELLERPWTGPPRIVS